MSDPQPDHTGNDEAGSAAAASGMPRSRGALGLVVFVLLAFAAGGIGSVLQGSEVGARYLAFERPVWAPPSWAFGVVWPVLYVLIGVAAWRVWHVAGGVRAVSWPLVLWAAQLVLNAAWPGVFFGGDALWAAVGVIVVLDVVVVATVVAFARVDRLAAALLVPYLGWILYATALNTAIAALN